MPGSAQSLFSQTPQLSVCDPRGLTVRNVEFHRRQSDAIPDTLISRQRFDEAGRLVACQDPRLGESGSDLENLVNLFSLSGSALASDSVDAGRRVTLAGSSGESRVVWDSRGQVRQNSFDEMLRLVAVSERAAGAEAVTVERLAYGAAEAPARNRCGRLTRHDDTAGTLCVTDYGIAGQPLSEQRRFLKELDAPDWPLEPDGREALVEAESFISQFAFNAVGDVVRQVDARQNIQLFGHDIAGHLDAVSLQSNARAPVAMVSQISFNALDQVERETAGNGVVTQAQYSPQSGLLVSLQSGVPGEPLLQRMDYEFDPVGNVTAVEDACQSSAYFRNQRIDSRNTYRYDSLYRLIEASGYESVQPEAWRGLIGQYAVHADSGQLANYEERYEYDLAGNLHTLIHSGGNAFTLRNVTSRFSNRSLQVQENWVPGEQEIDEGFDRNGNQLELFRGQALAWDSRNQLGQVTPVNRGTGQSDSECYIYDGSGQRLRKVQVASTRHNVRTWEVRYLPGLQLHFDSVGDKAWQVIELQAGRSQTSWVRWEQGDNADFGRYSLTDHLGSTTLELDEAGSVVSRESYYPFGGTAWWQQTGNAESFKTRRYSGKEQDASGLYYYGARYYAPWLMRWINPDPAGNIDGMNLFRFVRNNPGTMTDNDGRETTVTLLYGFDSTRALYLESATNASQQSVFTLDLMNAGIGITPDVVEEDYSGVIGYFFESDDDEESMEEDRAVPDEGVEVFLEKASHYKEGEGAARATLQSWSDYLYTHNEKFNVQKKLQRYADNPAKVSEFWRKNLNTPISPSAQNEATQLLMEDPAALFEHGSSEMKAAAQGVTNWLFRRLSKLGLDWAHSDSPALPDEVQFVDVGLRNPASPSEGWEDLSKAHYRAQAYKQDGAGAAYDPITYSERRHVDRNKLQRVNLLRLSQLQH